jgi:glycosyltransferase involved in cell wall biosynthesis
MLTAGQVARACAAVRREKHADMLRVLYVNRLSTSQHVDILLHAIASLRLPLRRIECAIVGDGPARENLQAQAIRLGLSNRVTFTGALNPDRILDYFEQANVLVLTPEIEEWARGVVAAMAFGLVCIGTAPECLQQTMADGCGLLVPSGDVQALGNALRRLAENPKESAAMSSRAAAWAQKQFAQSLAETAGTLPPGWTASVAALDQTPAGAQRIHAE